MNIKKLIREEMEDDGLDWIRDVKPSRIYRISPSNEMYISDDVVDSLDLPTTRDGKQKVLGRFTYNSVGIKYSFNAYLYPLNFGDGRKEWRVLGTSGDSGFGYSWITKRNTLSVRCRKQIFKQIINKYHLDSFVLSNQNIKESEDDGLDWIRDSKYRFPEYLSKLTKRETRSYKYGYGYKYSVKGKGPVLHFIPSRTGSFMKWDTEQQKYKIKENTIPGTLYIDYNLYDEISESYNDEDILYWFNNKTKNKATKLIRGIRDWR